MPSLWGWFRRRGRALLNAVGLLASLMVLSGLSGCASLSAVQTQALQAHPPAGLPVQTALLSTPFFPQAELQCGPAALATVMSAAGVPTTPDSLTRSVFLPARGGSLQIEMLAAPRAHGLPSTRIQPSMQALLEEVAAGHPVLVLLNLGLSIYPVWHYAVVIGYDLQASEALLRSGTTALLRLPLDTLEHTWSRSGQWAFVVLPPDQLPASASERDVVDSRVTFERVAPPPQAVSAYRTALQRWPDNLVLALGLANSLMAADDAGAAAAVLQAASTKHDRAAVWNNLATVRLKLGDKAAALSAALRAVDLAQSGEPRLLDAAQATLAEVRQTLTGK